MSNSKNTSVARPQRAAGTSKAADAALEHLRKLTATLRGNLETCATAPDIDPVHDVRTGTRRLQAVIEAILREHTGESLQEPASEWLDALKKMRRAAAPVRDLDVHRKLLHKLVKFGSKNEGAELIAPASDNTMVVGPSPDVIETPATELPTNPVADQAGKLDAWLHHARQHNAVQLKKRAAKQLTKFDALSSAMDAAMQQGRRTRRRPRSAAMVALESFARLVDEMQQLDANNLHDFRKGAKKARYIAETAAEDAHALAVGKALKRLQDDIGDWHDWLVLADEAGDALGDEGKELIALLDAERDRHYVLAMKTVNRLRGKLMGEWLAFAGSHEPVSFRARHSSLTDSS